MACRAIWISVTRGSKHLFHRFTHDATAVSFSRPTPVIGFYSRGGAAIIIDIVSYQISRYRK